MKTEKQKVYFGMKGFNTGNVRLIQPCIHPHWEKATVRMALDLEIQ